MDQAAVSSLRTRLARAPEALIAAYLYGSQARGDAGRDSDVDIGLLYGVPPVGTLASPALALEGEIERELGREVQTVVLNRAPSDLVQRVLRDGILLVDRDPRARLEFEVRALNEYFDMRPILDLYRRKGAG